MTAEPQTTTRTVVAPGKDGVLRVTRRAANGATITKQFREPRADLLGVDLDALSDSEIVKL